MSSCAHYILIFKLFCYMCKFYTTCIVKKDLFNRIVTGWFLATLFFYGESKLTAVEVEMNLCVCVIETHIQLDQNKSFVDTMNIEMPTRKIPVNTLNAASMFRLIQ